MYQKIKAKFKANPTIFYACSIVASWAGVGSLMNFRTLAINNGAAAAIIWAVFNSLACIFFGLFAEYIPTVRRIMQSKVMGSPPRMRGKGIADDEARAAVGITPACAGKSCPDGYTPCPARDHPRVCGEKSPAAV